MESNKAENSPPNRLARILVFLVAFVAGQVAADFVFPGYGLRHFLTFLVFYAGLYGIGYWGILRSTKARGA